MRSLFTARIRRMGKVMFSVCPHLGGGGQVQLGGGQIQPVGGGGSVSRGGSASCALLRAVCLLRSRRRTCLFVKKLQRKFHWQCIEFAHWHRYRFSQSCFFYGLFTLDDTENDSNTETDNDNYGFHCNMQSTLHCTKTLPLMPLATFRHFISITTYIVLGVAHCEHTIIPLL